MRWRGLLTSAVVTVVYSPSSGWAHPVEVHLSPSGIEFLETQARTYVPSVVEAPPITKDMYPCPGDDATFTQRNTVVHLTAHDLQFSIPASGTIRVDLTLSAEVDGEAHFEKPYACLGSTTCQDAVDIDRARAVVDFTLSVDEAGKLHAALANLDLQLTADQIEASFADCAISGIVNTAIDLAEEWAIEMLLAKVEQMAQEKIGPMLEEMLQGFGGISKSFGPLHIRAGLTHLDLSDTGIDLGADVDVSSDGGTLLDICPQPEGLSEPGSAAGARPDLRAGVPAHLGVAVNTGLLDDALFHVWSAGLMCVTPDLLDIFNIDLDLDHVADLLPGFPTGTQFRLMMYLLAPPTMGSEMGTGATMTMDIDGLMADLTALLPNGETRALHVELDASATVRIAIDPYVNALTMGLVEVNVDRLMITEEASADLIGFDFARIRQLLEERILPHVVEEMSGVPLTGPIFGGTMGYYVLLRELSSTGAYLLAKIDLFRAPEVDVNAPETRIDEAPTRVVAAKDAFIVVSGSDPEVPSELLRYEVVADSRLFEPTFVRKIGVGKVGESGTYSVEVRAMDLKGNKDPSPALVDVMVDGILPNVTITEAPRGGADTSEPRIAWEMSDDLTGAGELRPTISVYRLPDNGHDQESDAVNVIELARGETSATVPVGGGTWRVVVTVEDEAGNQASDSQIFSAAGAGGCGCDAGGRTPAPLAVALVLLGLVMVRMGRGLWYRPRDEAAPRRPRSPRRLRIR